MYQFGNGIRRTKVLFVFAAAVFLFVSLSSKAAAQTPITDYYIYTDGLSTGWDNWSWGTAVNFNDSAESYSGSSSAGITYTGEWGGFYLNNYEFFETRNHKAIKFWAHGGSNGGQRIKVIMLDEGSNGTSDVFFDLAANTWQEIEVPFADVGSPSWISAIMIQESHGSTQPTFYIDDVHFVAKDGTEPPPPSYEVTVDINFTDVKHAIDPHIYGMNWVDDDLANELGLPLNRWGGNAVTRYNYQLDVSNRASDWYFQNIANYNVDVNQLPNGSSADNWVDTNLSRGTSAIMTMPTIGWTPKSRDNTCGFSISKYGQQDWAAPDNNDCGSGTVNYINIADNDPADTSMAIDENWVQDWMQHLINKFGSADNGGVEFYALDNEPMLWNHTHRDVHPEPVGYDEVFAKSVQYAEAIKEVDPNAKTLGPVVWGWTAYYYSAVDAAAGDWDNPPDRNAHGGTPFLPWYLQQMKAYEDANGERLLDYLDVHYYPQISGVSLTTAGNAFTQQTRLQSTRSLWDADYVDGSWISDPVMLLPRLKDWVDTNYPGTKIGLTEYNWGGLEHINGALAQADILGIFGREGLDMAALWSPPTSEQPGAYAFRMYLNYDGQGSQFGNLSLPTTTTNPDLVSAFTARRSGDNATTIMLVNKSMGSATTTLDFSNFDYGATAKMYRYGVDNLNQIERLDDQFIDGRFGTTFELPADSITLLVLETAPTAVEYAFLPIVNNASPVQAAVAPSAAVLVLMTLFAFFKNN